MGKKPTLEDFRRYQRRIIAVERNIVMPIKIAVMLACFLYVFPTLWGVAPSQVSEDVTAWVRDVGLFKTQLILYVVVNVIFWFSLFFLGRRIRKIYFLKTTAFFLLIIDNLFITVLIVTTAEDPLETKLFWLFIGLVLHNAVIFPEIVPQAVVNLSFCLFYVGAVTLNVMQSGTLSAEAGQAGTLGAVLVSLQWNLLALRLAVLLLVGVACWGVYNLIQERLKVMAENQEKIIRVERLNLAGLIATSIAHELKNPLAIMSNAVYLLRKREDSLDPKVQRHVETLRTEIERSDKIITELLDYARLADGRIESVDVCRALDESVESLRHEIDSRNIMVIRNHADRLPPLFIDAGQLRTVFRNLLLNACEAIENLGRIEITTGYTESGLIEVKISDTGRGMTQEELGRIFEPFFTRKEGGTGLGLSIVNNIAQAYNARIDVESTAGKGTTFTLWFPTRTEFAKWPKERR